MTHGIPEEYSQNPDHIHKISGHTSVAVLANPIAAAILKRSL